MIVRLLSKFRLQFIMEIEHLLLSYTTAHHGLIFVLNIYSRVKFSIPEFTFVTVVVFVIVAVRLKIYHDRLELVLAGESDCTLL